MDRKLIFLDIDGTLVAAMAKPSLLVTEAVCRARENGHKVFLCTGRNMPIIGKDILDVGFDGVIASAGSHIEVEGNVIFDHLLSEGVIQECLSVFHDHGIFCRIESPEGIFTDPQMEELLRTAKPNPENSELIRMQKEIEAGIPILPYKSYPHRGAYKICFTSTTLEAVEKTKEFLSDRFGFVVHPYGDSTHCFNGEIIFRGVDKGKGMEIVCRYCKADLQDTIAFGDSMNDYEMIDFVNYGVVMANGSTRLKEIASTICKSVDEDGVYNEFINLGII